jgi:CRP-like cAMP-binding protein/AmiR/NasT family two-component response regulator
MTLAKVLVVEDDLLVSGDIQSTLKNLGFQVIGSAMRGDEAIRMAQELKPDVVLMDICLKGKLDGVAAASTIKETTDAAVIYLTAFSDGATFERAKITEPYGYIVKPFRETDLRITIRLALYKRQRNRVEHLAVKEDILTVDSPAIQADDIASLKELILKEIELFSLLSEPDRMDFAARCRSVPYAAGEILCSEGNDQSSCFIVVDGRVSMFKSSPNGRELIVEILPPKDISNLVAAFEDQPAAVTVRATTKSTVLLVPKKALFELLNQHPEFYRLFVKEANQRLRSAYNIMRAMAHDKVEARIAAMLTELSKRSSLCTTTGKGIRITRQELADLTGTTPETAIRVTRALEDKGVLGLSKRGAIEIINMAELREYASSV